MPDRTDMINALAVQDPRFSEDEELIGFRVLCVFHGSAGEVEKLNSSAIEK